MRIHHHPDGTTLMAYAAGTLDEALAVVAACHLAWCPCCRRTVRAQERVGGALVETVGGTALSSGALEAMLGRLDGARAEPASPGEGPPAEETGLPRPVCRLVGAPLDALPWRRVVPGVRVHEIGLSPGARGRLLLLRIAPGKAMPAHGHGGGELTLVLRGSYRDELGRFSMGDIADLDEAVEHRPVVDSGADCVCLLGTDSPLRLKGLLTRLLRPLLGL